MPDSDNGQTFRQPFQPVTDVSGRDPAIRIAHALEYLAFQSGEINTKLDRLIAAIEVSDDVVGALG